MFDMFCHDKVIDNDTNQQVVGVVPITFAVFGLDWKFLRLRTIGAPVYEATPSIGGSSSQGYFSIDIFSENDSPLPQGQYVIFAFTEGIDIGIVYGPQKMDYRVCCCVNCMSTYNGRLPAEKTNEYESDRSEAPNRHGFEYPPPISCFQKEGSFCMKRGLKFRKPAKNSGRLSR